MEAKMAKKSDGPDNKIFSYAYDSDRRLFEVTFDNGETHTYTDVPKYVYDLFTDAISKDRFVKEFVEVVGYREVKSSIMFY